MNDEWGATVYQVRDSETRQERNMYPNCLKIPIIRSHAYGDIPSGDPDGFHYAD